MVTFRADSLQLMLACTVGHPAALEAKVEQVHAAGGCFVDTSYSRCVQVVRVVMLRIWVSVLACSPWL